MIQKRASPPSVYGRYLSAAIRCQSHISAIAERGSLSERYCLVLEELRIEALRQTERSHQSANSAHRTRPNSPSNGLDNHPIGPIHDVDDTTDFADPAMNTAGSDLSDFNGWDQFASMISSGLGNLDGFFDDDPFQLQV